MKEAPTHQHYVPQFVLRNFATGRSKQIHVFDKTTGRSFKTAVRNIASESGFYDIEINGEPHSLDPSFQKLEDGAKEPIRKIIQSGSVHELSIEERAILAIFVSVQMLRTNVQRNQYKDLNDKLRELIEQHGGDPHNTKGFSMVDRDQARVEQIRLLPELASELAPHFVNKTWLMYRPPQHHAFYISDNPVAMHNTVNQNPDRGTVGLAVPGIEIYFPLSASVCLGFLCPSLEAMIRDGKAWADRVGAPMALNGFIRALDRETALELVPDSLIHQNSLQVIHAERYVFSSNGDFALVREMLRSHPKLKGGPRYNFA